MKASVNVVAPVATSTQSNAAPMSQPTPPLRQNVKEFVKRHLLQWEAPTNVYDLILAEIEAPLLEIVLQYVRQNQSETARILAMSRGTLRKKMQRYGLLPKSKKDRDQKRLLPSH